MVGFENDFAGVGVAAGVQAESSMLKTTNTLNRMEGNFFISLAS